MAVTHTPEHIKSRVSEVSRIMAELTPIAKEGGDVAAHSDWEYFSKNAPPGLAERMLENAATIRRQKALLDLISDCTAEPDPDLAVLNPTQATPMMLRKTNKLLAAILMKLHGVE